MGLNVPIAFSSFGLLNYFILPIVCLPNIVYRISSWRKSFSEPIILSPSYLACLILMISTLKSDDKNCFQLFSVNDLYNL